MRKQNRIVIRIAFLGILLLCSFYILPKESELYLKTDILDLRSSLMPISIIFSIVFALLLLFHKAEFDGGKWSKAIYIGHLGMMSYLIFGLTSDILTTVALKTNRISKTETMNKIFVVSSFKETTNGKLTKSGPWVIKADNKYEVRGRLSDKSYENDIDGIFMDKTDYEKIKQKNEFEITLQKGLLGILCEPIITE